MDAYTPLIDRLHLDQGYPFTEHWTAATDFLEYLVNQTLESVPGLILECGSGLSTLMLARCCEINRKGEVLSLENGAEFARATRQYLETYGLDTVARIIDAPLNTLNINENDYQWYQLPDLENQSIEMLVVDGPPGFIQPLSRYPALPLLYDKLADGCLVLMDDAARSDEQEIAAMWRETYPSLDYEYLDFERGCSVFRVNR